MVKLRQATEADTALLAEVGARTFRDAFGGQNTAEDMARYLAGAFSQEKMIEEIREPGSSFFIAFVDDQSVGYIKLRTSKRPACIEDDAPIELERIYVDQHCIGQGVGAALMQRAINEARQAGYKTIWLGVWKKNDSAIAFYKKWGYEIVGEHEFVVGEDVQHDHIMAKRI